MFLKNENVLDKPHEILCFISDDAVNYIYVKRAEKHKMCGWQ